MQFHGWFKKQQIFCHSTFSKITSSNRSLYFLSALLTLAKRNNYFGYLNSWLHLLPDSQTFARWLVGEHKLLAHIRMLKTITNMHTFITFHTQLRNYMWLLCLKIYPDKRVLEFLCKLWFGSLLLISDSWGLGVLSTSHIASQWWTTCELRDVISSTCITALQTGNSGGVCGSRLPSVLAALHIWGYESVNGWFPHLFFL